MRCRHRLPTRVVASMQVCCAAVLLSVAGAPAVAFGAPQAAAPATPAATGAALPPLAGPRPQQDALTDADQAPGTNINVSFTDNFIADRLPFDVPFNVVGSLADANIKRLDLTVYRVAASVDLANLITYLQKTVDCVGTKPPGRQVSKSTATPGTGGRFSLFVNALDPQYYYALCFIGVTPVPSTEIDRDVREIVMGALGTLDTEPDISSAMVTEVRRWMSARIADLGARRPVRAIIPPGNLFDVESSARNDDLLADHAVELRIPFSNLPREFKNYQDESALLRMNAAAAGALVTGITLPTDSVLPGVDSAISENTPFNFDAFRFDSALQMLKAVLAKSPSDAVSAVLKNVTELARLARNYGRLYDQLRVAVVNLVNKVALEVRDVDVALGSSALGADLNRSAYVSLDAGLAYPWRLESMVFYAGTNIYFRPINKRAPLRYKGSFLHRFALTVGVTTTVTDESRRATDLRATSNNKDTSNSLLLGGGMRVTPSMRVGAGVLVFKESDPNPLINQTSVAVTPYVAFAADVNVAEIFRSMF